jgi:hypothetical protein
MTTYQDDHDSRVLVEFNERQARQAQADRDQELHNLVRDEVITNYLNLALLGAVLVGMVVLAVKAAETLALWLGWLS